MFQENLCQIGLTKRESEVYIELLRIGSQAVSVIAKRAGLKRTTTYSILNSLKSKGLVASFIKNGIRFFDANDPNCLIAFLDRKCRKFDYYKSQMLAIIPKFRDLVDDYDFQKPVVSYCDGLESIRNSLFDANYGDSVCMYLPVYNCDNPVLKEILLEYLKTYIPNMSIDLRLIAPNSEKLRKFFDKNFSKKNMAFKLFYVDGLCFGGGFNGLMNIYNDRVSTIHLIKGAEYAVVINSKEITDTQKGIFETLWNLYTVNNYEKNTDKRG